MTWRRAATNMLAVVCLAVGVVVFLHGIGLDKVDPPQGAVAAQAAMIPTTPPAASSGGDLSSELEQTGHKWKSVANQWEELFGTMLDELYQQRATIRKLKRELAECRAARSEN